MKKYIYLFAISVIFNSCSGDGGDDPEPAPIPENKIPSVPVLTVPTNGKLCIDNTVDFQWNGSTDPDGDAITYQIQVAKDNQFSQIAHTLTGSDTNNTISLERGIAYYWRVSATDSKNESSSYSSTFNFYTEGDGEINHLPFSPELVKPDLNLVVQPETTTLEWNANDVDTSDSLIFDVYFGTVNPPTTLVGANQATNTLEVNLTSITDYYWKVVVKDQNGGETIGQVWNFKTD